MSYAQSGRKTNIHRHTIDQYKFKHNLVELYVELPKIKYIQISFKSRDTSGRPTKIYDLKNQQQWFAFALQIFSYKLSKALMHSTRPILYSL